MEHDFGYKQLKRKRERRRQNMKHKKNVGLRMIQNQNYTPKTRMSYCNAMNNQKAKQSNTKNQSSNEE
jgi:hypothetical protein